MTLADSFNDLVKAIAKQGPDYPVGNSDRELAGLAGWLPLIAGLEKGRFLGDQLAHQKGFHSSTDVPFFGRKVAST